MNRMTRSSAWLAPRVIMTFAEIGVDVEVMKADLDLVAGCRSVVRGMRGEVDRATTSIPASAWRIACVMPLRRRADSGTKPLESLSVSPG